MQFSEFDSSDPFEGLRLADKRSLPCPRRYEWLAARDDLYEQIMEKAWNVQKQQFGQCYEETDVLDSSVLIMPLVFFIQPVSIL
jgi:GH15 family glucan-1,4-alpha-glucosidase